MSGCQHEAMAHHRRYGAAPCRRGARVGAESRRRNRARTRAKIAASGPGLAGSDPEQSERWCGLRQSGRGSL